MDSKELAETMEVALSKKCVMNWDLQNNFERSSVLTNLVIVTSPKCSLNNDLYTVKFNNIFLITDLVDNHLSKDTLQIKAYGYTYKDEIISLKVAGSIINYSSLIIVVVMIGLSIFQSMAVGSVWNFVNMIQMLSYLPILDCYIPDNLEIFLTEYITAKSIVIPFNIIPDFPYNPLKYLELFLTDPFNETFGELDFESINFIYNFADELLT